MELVDDLVSPDFGKSSGEEDASKSSGAVRPGRSRGLVNPMVLPAFCYPELLMGGDAVCWGQVARKAPRRGTHSLPSNRSE